MNVISRVFMVFLVFSTLLNYHSVMNVASSSNNECLDAQQSLCADQNKLINSPKLTENLKPRREPNSVSEAYPKVTVGYGGSAGSLIINWKQLAGNISSMDVALYSKKFLPRLKWLHHQGINLTVGIDWRPNSLTNPNPLDFYYNLTFRNEVFSVFDHVFDAFPRELASAIRVGDEEPNNAYQWFSFSGNWPEEIAKYNSTYHSETGFWFKNLEEMNSTERQTWEQWMEERNTFAYNTMYNYLKSLYPEKQIIMAIMENYHFGFDPSAILTDVRSGYQFYTDDPRAVYAAIRYAKTSYPNASVSTGLWGVEKFGFYKDFDKTDFKRLAYAAYIAGANSIGWFTFGNDERGRGLPAWQRTDKKGKEVFDYLNSLNRELMSLPAFNPSPRILEIAEYDTSGSSKGIGFLEWDNTNQLHASSPEFDLSKYDLIIIKEQSTLLTELVQKINDYINNGGNVICIGSTGSAKTDPYGETRPSLVFEEGITEYRYYQESVNVTMDGNNPLQIITNIPMTYSGRTTVKYTNNSNYQFIRTGAIEESQGYFPLFIYHNNSNPKAGHVLYYGFPVEWDSELLPLWFEALNGFAKIINFYEGIATQETAKMLVSISEFKKENRYIVGFINDNEEREIFQYEFNFEVRNLTEQTLWLYQRDKAIEWVGELSFNNHKTTIGITPFKQEDAVLFELLPPWPTGRLIVNTYALEMTPVVGETFTVRGDVANILRYTKINNVNASIELPSGITLASTSQTATIELGDIYPPTRSGFGYPMSFYWYLKASKAGNYSLRVTVTGENVDPITKFFFVEVMNYTIDITLEQTQIYLTPNEPFSWKVGVHLRGNEELKNVKIWLYFPYSDWYAPHKEITIGILEPGEYTEVIFNYNKWYEIPPPWSIPGESIIIICTSIVNGLVGNDAYGFINVVPSKIRVTATEQQVEVGKESIISIQLRALGVVAAQNIKLELMTASELKIGNTTRILLGTLNPTEMTTVNISLTALTKGVFYLEVLPSSTNSYCEKSFIVINAMSKESAQTTILVASISVIIGIGIGVATVILSPKIVEQIKSWRK